MELKEASAKYLPNEKLRVQAGYKQTELGVIPWDWEVVQLTTLAKLESGHTPSRRNPEYWNGDIPWVSLHDTDSLDGKEIFITNQYVTQKGIDNSSARVLPKGTVIFSRTATVGKTTVLGREMATSQDFANYICGPSIYNHYLVYLFRNMRPEWKKLMAGSIHNTVYMPVFKTLKIVFPPRLEQEAIAEALSDADALIEALEQLIAKKRQLKQGAMQELLTGQRRLPGFNGDWLYKAISSFSAFITKGATPTTYGFDWQNDGILFLRSECVSEEGIDLKGAMFISDAAHSVLSRSEVRSGDILITITGNVGRVIHLADGFDNANINQHIARIRVKDLAISSEFIFHWLSQPSVRTYFSMITTGQAYPQISLKQVRDTLIPLPTYEEQTAIAQILTDMDAEIAELENKLAKARAVKQGMMQQLLTGRIRLL